MSHPDLCYATLQIGGAVFEGLESVRGHEAIGEPFRYDLLVIASLPLPRPSALLGAPASLTLGDEYGQRTLQGVASEVQTFATDKERGRIRVVFVPLTHPLTLGRASRSFQEMSAIDVVEKIVAPACPVVRALSRKYPAAPYRVQREEDDWSFVVRTLRAEGVTFYYDHDEGSCLVLTDDTRGAPSISGLSVFPYRPGGLDTASEAIVSLARAAGVKTTTFARKSFSWKNPGLALSVSTGKGRYEQYDAPGGGPSDPSALERTAKDAQDAASSAASGIAGEAATLRIYPGRAFSIAAQGIDDAWFSGEWLATSMDISLAGPRDTFVTQFKGIAKDITFRPAPAAGSASPKKSQSASWGGGQPGLSWGIVIAEGGDEVFPDESGRVRVQAHWDRDGARDSKAGAWMRVAQRCNPGSMMFPRTGWLVATMNEEGSADAPSVLSRIHDGERPPEYSLPANKTRVVFKTATSPGGGSHNEIHFEDKKGGEVVFWNASRNMDVLVKSDASERVDNDAWHDVGVNQTVSSGMSYGEQVNVDQTVTIGANQKTALGGDRAKSVGANDTVTVGGSRTLKIGESCSLGVSQDRNLTVGAAQLDTSLGQIGTQSTIAIQTVGGAIVRIGAKNFTEDASLASAELVGAVKVETAGENRTLGVEKRFIEAVGGAVRVDAGKRYIDSATKKSSWAVGALVKGTTKEVTLEGYTSIELRCGQSSVVLEPEEIRLEASTLKLDGAELEAVTGVIVHNG